MRNKVYVFNNCSLCLIYQMQTDFRAVAFRRLPSFKVSVFNNPKFGRSNPMSSFIDVLILILLPFPIGSSPLPSCFTRRNVSIIHNV